MVAKQLNIYEDLANFIASLSPENILAYHPTDKIQRQVEYLVIRKKEGEISPAESQELEMYFLFEHIIRLAKARALRIIAQTDKLTDMEHIPIPVNEVVIDRADLYKDRI